MFTTWYLGEFISKLTDTNKNYVIGVTAFTKAAIINLLERISCTTKGFRLTILSLIKDLKKDGLKECEPSDLFKMTEGYNKFTIVGGTVWDWYKVRQSVECDIMMIDEGSQVSII